MALVKRGYRIYCDKKLEYETVLDNDTLEINIDGKYYTINLIPGVYFTHHAQFESDLPKMISQILKDHNIPVICKLGGIYDYANNRTVLVFEHKDTQNAHMIRVEGGTAFDLLIGDIVSVEPHVDGFFYHFVNMSGSISVVYPDLIELPSTIVIRKDDEDKLESSMVVRKSSTGSLKSSIRIASASLLYSSIAVRNQGASQIIGTLSVPTDDLYDLGSFLIVKNS